MGRGVSKRGAEHVVFVINYLLTYRTQLKSHPNVSPQTFSFHNPDKQAEPYNDNLWAFKKNRFRLVLTYLWSILFGHGVLVREGCVEYRQYSCTSTCVDRVN